MSALKAVVSRSRTISKGSGHTMNDAQNRYQTIDFGEPRQFLESSEDCH